MDEIKVYISTTAKSTGRQHIAGALLIEFVISGKPITTKLGALGTLIYDESSTAQRITVFLLTRAFKMLPQMIKEYMKDPPKTVSVYVDPAASGSLVNKWYETWAKNGYMKASGENITNAEQWESLNSAISQSSLSPEYYTEHHSYSDVMSEYVTNLLSKNVDKHSKKQGGM